MIDNSFSQLLTETILVDFLFWILLQHHLVLYFHQHHRKALDLDLQDKW